MTMMTNDLQDNVNAAIEAMEGANVTAPKTKGIKKPKLKTAKEVKETKETPKAPAANIEGIELADGADVEAVKSATDQAATAVEAIHRKDADLLDSYLALGAFNSIAAKSFKSVKLMGQYIAKCIPASQELDPALRSNCKWLHEALNDPAHAAYGQLLRVLNVNDIASYKSCNPTVIRRDYSKLAKADEAKAKAEALGLDGEDAEKALADQAKADAEAMLNEVLEIFRDKVASTKLTKADIAASVADLLRVALAEKKDRVLEALNAFSVSKAP